MWHKGCSSWQSRRQFLILCPLTLYNSDRLHRLHRLLSTVRSNSVDSNTPSPTWPCSAGSLPSAGAMEVISCPLSRMRTTSSSRGLNCDSVNLQRQAYSMHAQHFRQHGRITRAEECTQPACSVLTRAHCMHARYPQCGSTSICTTQTATCTCPPHFCKTPSSAKPQNPPRQTPGQSRSKVRRALQLSWSAWFGSVDRCCERQPHVHMYAVCRARSSWCKIQSHRGCITTGARGGGGTTPLTQLAQV
jgi:hypothetical protein